MTITIEFQSKHNPGTEAHLRVIAHNYLRGKGVNIGEDGIIRI